MWCTLRQSRGSRLIFGFGLFLLGVATGATLALNPDLVLPAVSAGVAVIAVVSGFRIAGRMRSPQGDVQPGLGGDDGWDGLSGVREPRSPRPPADGGAVALLPPRGDRRRGGALAS